MTNKRMFSLAVINSARFLRMPISCQALYFHLGMRADDDGIVEAFPVIRCTGCTEDDLRVLVSKGFCTVLNEDLVTYITDWRENNYIRPDRAMPSRYRELLIQMVPDKCQASAGQVPGKCRTNDGHLPGKCRTNDGIDQIRSDQIRSDQNSFIPPTVEEVAAYAKEKGLRMDAASFVDYNTAKGWKVGNGPMKDWRAAARGWARRGQKKKYETERTDDLNAIVEALA